MTKRVEKLEVHPVACIFPMMSDSEFLALKEDIRANGLQEGITFWKDFLVDGRNRLKACQELGIDPFLTADELLEETDPEKWIISRNLHRRHMNPSQKSLVGAKLRDYYAGIAKQQQKKSPGRPKNGESEKGKEKLPYLINGQQSRDMAGEAVGVSGKLIDAATKVLERGSAELVELVAAGEVSVTRAAKAAKSHDKRSQVSSLKDKHPPKQDAGYIERARKLFDSLDDSQRNTVASLWTEWIDKSE